MKVTNLTSPRTGAKVANQFVINDKGIEYFQSYDTIIAKKDNEGYTISSDYNYSNTTSRYFRQWLVEWGFDDNMIKILKKWLETARDGDYAPVELREQLFDVEGVQIKYVDSL